MEPVLLLAAISTLIVVPLTYIYNKSRNHKKATDTSWEQVALHLSRRSEILLNLIAAAKSYPQLNQQALMRMAHARVEAMKTMEANPANIVLIEAKQKELTDALTNLSGFTSQYYPILSDERYVKIQKEIAEAEEAIRVAYNDYNELASIYNSTLDKFPMNLFSKKSKLRNKRLHVLVTS